MCAFSAILLRFPNTVALGFGNLFLVKRISTFTKRMVVIPLQSASKAVASISPCPSTQEFQIYKGQPKARCVIRISYTASGSCPFLVLIILCEDFQGQSCLKDIPVFNAVMQTSQGIPIYQVHVLHKLRILRRTRGDRPM